MTGLITMRPYQDACVGKIFSALHGGMRRPAAVLATGLGKTVIFSHIAAAWHESAHRSLGRGRRVLVLAHRTELVEQAADKLRSVAPTLKIGIVKAERNETLADIVVASVQTLRSLNRRRQLLDVGLIIVDECHHATAPTYLKILQHFGALEGEGSTAYSDAVAIGFTATMSRGDELSLGTVWEDVVFNMGIADGIADGYLVRPRGKRVSVAGLDFSKAKTRGGDYSEGRLGAALEDSLAPEAVAKAITEHAPDRPTVLFAPTVRSAQIIGDAVADAGFRVGAVWGEMEQDDRTRTLDDFADGKIQVVTNCMVLTEGWDSPATSCAVIARPTVNPALYIQMVGRILRPHPGKRDALVLDVVGASQRHALAARVELFGEEAAQRGERDAEDLFEVQDERLGVALGLEEELGVDGPLVSEDVDLFHGSESAWLTTRGGTWFLPAGERFIAIVPGRVERHWDVVAMHRYRRGVSRWVQRDVPDKSYAMVWAEGDVTSAETMTTRKERSWRVRKPSQSQLDLCARYGITVVDGMHAGEVSSMIARDMASKRIDPILASVGAR